MLNACCSYPEVIDADRFLLPLLRLGADDFLRCKGCHLEVGPAEFHPPRVTRRDSTKWYLGDFCHGASLVWIYM